MLTSLSIKNFALIEQLSISFESGFTTITGETGAGKSILLGALGLVLGKRADVASLKNKDEKCVIEAHFDIAKYNLKAIFEQLDFDYEEHTIIRREILSTGKSRAFVNDSPVTITDLQELGMYLLDIHSQQQTQELSSEKIQFEIIDAIALNTIIVDQYSILLKKYKIQTADLKKYREAYSNAQKEQDYNAFLLNELTEAKLVIGIQEELEQSFQELTNVESVKENLEKALAIGEDEQVGVLQQLKDVKLALQKIATITPEYQTIFERVQSIVIEFDDLLSELNGLTDKLVDDPEQLELVHQKLQLIYSLQKKHQVNTIEELLQIQTELQNKVFQVQSLDESIVELEKSMAIIEAELNVLAAQLHKNRAEAVPVLTEKLRGYLAQLGMPNARFDIQIQQKK